MNKVIRESRPSSSISCLKTQKNRFTNPVLRVWMSTYKYEDSEYLFHQLGNWPNKCILKVPKAKIELKKLPIKEPAKLVKVHNSQNEFRIAKTRSVSGNPWLYKPNQNSLFKPVGKSSLNLYL